MKRRFFSAVLLVLAAVLPLGGQTPSSVRVPEATARLKGRPAFRPYSNNTGISQKSIRRIVMDKRGMLWVAALDNENGLAYLSGDRWVPIQVPGRSPIDIIHGLLATTDGSLWVGHDRGLARYRDGVWQSYLPTEAPERFRKIHDLIEEKVAEDRIRIWISNDFGLYRLEVSTTGAETPRWEFVGQTKPNSRAGLNNATLLAGRDGSGQPYLWIGTNQDGLVRYDGKNWEVFTSENSGLPSDAIRCLFETRQADGNRILWIGTDNGGLARFDGRTWEHFDTRNSPLANNSVQSLTVTVDAAGQENLWVGTYGGGLTRFPVSNYARTALWERFDIHNSTLPSDNVWTLLADPSADRQALWIGTESGLFRFAEGQWETLDTRNSPLPNSGIYCFLETKTADNRPVMWMGTRNGGVTRWTGPGNGKPESWNRYDVETTGLFHDRANCLTAIHEPDGRTVIWAASYTEGLAVFENERWRLAELPQFYPHIQFIRAMLETADGNGGHIQWLATRDGGLLRREKGQWTRIRKGDAGFPGDITWSLLEADLPGGGGRTVWVGSKYGLSYLKNGQWVTFDEHSAGFNINLRTSLLETSGPDGRRSLWTGSMWSGVYQLDLADPAAKWTRIDTLYEDLFPNAIVYGLAADANQGVYILTHSGAIRLISRVPNPTRREDFDFRLFTTEDGLPSNEFNLNATLLDRSGRVWAGTVAGAAIFDPARFIAPRTGGSLILERGTAGKNKSLLQKGQVLTYDQNTVSFTYSLLNYYRPSETRYQYQLVGVDPAPSPWSEAVSHEYSNLGAGQYTFKVWARNSAGQVIGPVSTTFTIRPAIWKSGVAYFIYSLAIALSLFLILKFRTIALERLNTTLEARVAERTTELARTIELLRQTQAQVDSKNEQLRHSQKMETIGQLAGGIAHNFNNILAIILGYSELLLSQSEEGDPNIRPLRAIDKAGKRGRDLVRKLMAFSRKTESRPEVIDLNGVVNGTISIVEQVIGGRCVIQANLEPIPAIVRVDRQELEQALINLFINARDAMAGGGVIQVNAGHIRIGAPERSVFEGRGKFVRFTRDGKSFPTEEGRLPSIGSDKHFICLSIRDSGVGMSDNVIEHLFEPFFTTKEEGKGTGLGLATVFGAVTGAGGYIEVESELGEGTVFRLFFPIFEDEATLLRLSGSGETNILRQFRGNQETILVIEDEAGVRDFITQALEAMNYRVIAFESGPDGLSHLRANRDSVAIVLTDVALPGLSGIEIAKIIKVEFPGLPVISMSGHNEPPSGSAGIRTHLEKPFSAQALVQAVKLCLTGVLQ